MFFGRIGNAVVWIVALLVVVGFAGEMPFPHPADGVVRLTVEKTSKLLRYGVSSGKNPAVLAADTSFPRKDGNDDADIMIEAPAKGASEFFKVGRAPLK